MATLATDLLDFILDLLRDEDAAAEFLAAPRETLEREGLSDVCLADLDEVQSLLRFVPELAESSAGLAPSSAGTSVASASLPPTVTLAPAVPLSTQVSPIASAEDDVVIERLRDIQQTFTYNANTTIDARDSVWAGRDVYEIFGDDNVMAVGGSVAADGDVEDVELDHSIEDSFNPVNSGNTQTGTGNVNGDDADVDLENSGNRVDGDGNVFGRDNDVDNTDRSVEGDGNAVGANASADNSERSTEVEDSAGVIIGGGNTVGDVAAGEDSAAGNTTTVQNSGNTDESDNSVTDNSDNSVTDESDNSVTDNSDNSVTDESDNSVTDNSDNSVTDESDNSVTDNSDNSVTDESDNSDNSDTLFVTDNVVVADNDDNDLDGITF